MEKDKNKEVTNKKIIKDTNIARTKMIEAIEKDGRVGTTDVKEIKKLKEEDKLLEAFFSAICLIEHQLQTNYHHKFHVNLWMSTDEELFKRDENKLWKEFTKTFDKLYTLIFVSYSTEIIDEKLYERLEEVRKLRNKIAHKLLYYEPDIFITRKQVKNIIDECIELISILKEKLKEVIFDGI